MENTKRKMNLLISVLAITLLVFSLMASASMIIPSNDNAKENSNAPENSPVIGNSWGIERIDFIHYVKPENPGKPGKNEQCYKLMGVKWNSLPVNYVINPSNPQGLSEEFVTITISTSAETWDDVTSKELFNNYNVDFSAIYGVLDNKNTIAFGNYGDNSVIAVTSVWYIPARKQIVEFDQLYNTQFSWGDALNNSLLIDLQNIATHELGHSVGLGDIYSTTCSEVTMYGYSTEGETKKRTLEQPDINGLRKIYGA